MKKSGFYFISQQDRYADGMYGVEYTFSIEEMKDGE